MFKFNSQLYSLLLFYRRYVNNRMFHFFPFLTLKKLGVFYDGFQIQVANSEIFFDYDVMYRRHWLTEVCDVISAPTIYKNCTKSLTR